MKIPLKLVQFFFKSWLCKFWVGIHFFQSWEEFWLTEEFFHLQWGYETLHSTDVKNNTSLSHTHVPQNWWHFSSLGISTSQGWSHNHNYILCYLPPFLLLFFLKDFLFLLDYFLKHFLSFFWWQTLKFCQICLLFGLFHRMVRCLGF